MSVGQHEKKLKLLVAGLILTLPLSLLAGGNLPVVPKAKAKATAEYGCVNPVADMRKNHMEYLLHQRYQTMHKGIRTKKYSLAECIECHVSADKNGKYAEYGDDDFFCSSCHNYAAVSIDCFQCHNDKPQSAYSSLSSNRQSLPEGHEKFASNDALPSGDAE
ncbi:MAG TPA: hypothetical protein ENI98_02715 [Gammaproteobacteria bacterium]|nr:hypothetical protein [Gammaproteobacteria bacterium]